jgi:Sulfotransferase domain
MLQLFILFFCAFSSLNAITEPMDHSRPNSIENAEIFLGYPRSGNNWTMAILQITTQRRILPIHSYDIKFSHVLYSLNFKTNPNKPILYRTHGVHPIMRQINHSKNKLLFILRNYKECIVRECGYDDKELKNSVLTNTGGFQMYINDLIFFDRDWKDSSTKMMIYYEDLISKPRETIEKLLTFFNEPLDNLDDFFDNYDYWKDLVLTKYHEVHNKVPSSGGDKKVFHSKDFSARKLKKIDSHIKETYPDLWAKYLSVYQS